MTQTHIDQARTWLQTSFRASHIPQEIAQTLHEALDSEESKLKLRELNRQTRENRVPFSNTTKE